MKKVVVTIERQYGSGGRTVGEMLADELGIHYYDKELVKLAADESGISEALFVTADESIRQGKAPLLRRMKKSVYKGGVLSPEDNDFTSMQNLFNYQAEVIKKLADTKPCVIIGRCANYVLRDYDNVVSVFVHAPQDFLMEQAALKQPMRGKELEKFIKTTDKYRADYYKYYTGERWEDAYNYDLCLNSGRLGFEKCVEAIKEYMKVRFGEDVFE